jgi:hypothetical protein
MATATRPAFVTFRITTSPRAPAPYTVSAQDDHRGRAVPVGRRGGSVDALD